MEEFVADAHKTLKLFEQVKNFTYLGQTFSDDGTHSMEIAKRIALAGNRAVELSKIWKSNMKISIKCQLYKSLVLSVLLYACETWVVLKKDEQKLEAFQNRLLKRIIGARIDDHVNIAELRKTCQCQPIKDIIAKRRLKLWRKTMQNGNSLGNTILTWKIKNAKKQIGGQRKTWLSQVKDTVEGYDQTLERCQDMNVKDWKKFMKSID